MGRCEGRGLNGNTGDIKFRLLHVFMELGGWAIIEWRWVGQPPLIG